MHMRVRDEEDADAIRIEAAGETPRLPRRIDQHGRKYRWGDLENNAKELHHTSKSKKYHKQVFDRRSGIIPPAKMSSPHFLERRFNQNQWHVFPRYHHLWLLRCVGFRKKKPTDHVLLLIMSYLLQRLECLRIKAMVRRSRLTVLGWYLNSFASLEMMLFGEP